MMPPMRELEPRAAQMAYGNELAIPLVYAQINRYVANSIAPGESTKSFDLQFAEHDHTAELHRTASDAGVDQLILVTDSDQGEPAITAHLTLGDVRVLQQTDEDHIEYQNEIASAWHPLHELMVKTNQNYPASMVEYPVGQVAHTRTKPKTFTTPEREISTTVAGAGVVALFCKSIRVIGGLQNMDLSALHTTIPAVFDIDSQLAAIETELRKDPPEIRPVQRIAWDELLSRVD